MGAWNQGEQIWHLLPEVTAASGMLCSSAAGIAHSASSRLTCFHSFVHTPSLPSHDPTLLFPPTCPSTRLYSVMVYESLWVAGDIERNETDRLPDVEMVYARSGIDRFSFLLFLFHLFFSFSFSLSSLPPLSSASPWQPPTTEFLVSVRYHANCFPSTFSFISLNNPA